MLYLRPLKRVCKSWHIGLGSEIHGWEVHSVVEIWLGCLCLKIVAHSLFVAVLFANGMNYDHVWPIFLKEVVHRINLLLTLCFRISDGMLYLPFLPLRLYKYFFSLNFAWNKSYTLFQGFTMFQKNLCFCKVSKEVLLCSGMGRFYRVER